MLQQPDASLLPLDTMHPTSLPEHVAPSNLTQKQPNVNTRHFVPKPPFPQRFMKKGQEEVNHDVFETFQKVQVNIPLLEAIKQVPRYVKFLKELCTSKRKLKGHEKITMNENVFAMFQHNFPNKFKDPGMFTIPCKISKL